MDRGVSILEARISEGSDGWRLDRALAEAVPILSRERLKALIASGAVADADGALARDPAKKAVGGAHYTVTVPLPAPAHNEAQDIPLNVVFEGQWQTMDPRWNTMTNFSSQIPFEGAFARHFSWGKPWQARPLGVEPEALRLYRALAKATPWVDRFGASPSAAGLRFRKKRLGRKFDRVLGILTGKEKLVRRSRYEAGRALSLFADHARKGLAAIRFPEKALGLEANQTAVP